MIPLSFEQTFDRSLLLLSTVGAGSWTITSASTGFPLTAVSATDGFNCSDTSLCLVVLTVISDDRRHRSSSRGETTETVVKALPPSPRLTALQTSGNAERTERYAGPAIQFMFQPSEEEYAMPRPFDIRLAYRGTTRISVQFLLEKLSAVEIRLSDIRRLVWHASKWFAIAALLKISVC